MKSLFILIIFANLLFANVGKIVALKGEANITRENRTFQVKRDTLLKEKDILITKNNSKVQILFKDETIISIGKNSTFKINDYLFENKDNVKAEFSMIKGVFRTITGRIGKIAPQNFKLKTKSASIGIRGTQIITDITDGKERIFCTEGQIEVTQNLTNLKIIVNQGEFIAMHENNGAELLKNKTKTKDLKEVNKNVSISENKAVDTVSIIEEVSSPEIEETTSNINSTPDVVEEVNEVEKSEKVSEQLSEQEEAEAEAQRIAGELAAAEEERLAQEAAAAAEAKRIAAELAAAEAQRIADELAAKLAADEEERLAQEAAAAAEAKRIADELAAAEAQRIADELAAAEEQRLAQEAAAAAEAKRIADELAAAEAQRIADELAAAEEERLAQEAAAAAETKRIADELAAAEEQRLADELAAAEEQRLAQEAAAAAEAKRIADELAAAEEQRLADELAAAEAQRLADELAAAELAESLKELTPSSYFENNNSKATYIGNFNASPFDDKRQYIEYDDDKTEYAIPEETTISMDIDFGKSKDQVSNGKISVEGQDDLEFDGKIKSDNSIQLKAANNTTGGGGDAYLYGSNGEILKGDIKLKNDDLKLEGDFEANKSDFIDLTQSNDLEELTNLDYFIDNSSYATYKGDFNSSEYDASEQYKEVLGVKYEIPEETTISMGIDFGADSNQISNGLITQDNPFTTDFTFDGSINDDKSFTLTGSGDTEGTGSGNFYGNEADVIKGQVDMQDKYSQFGTSIKGNFEADKE
ncbi:FecR family protein [Arcobacter peruensis]|uniref:FecR family protein n=1 Tax=Arcobacter peruensis TaxID=2320140 RepID=UPI000F077EB7|nr:FecR family protein [Arcobacter peruensis]